jgi:hypothetical protein
METFFSSIYALCPTASPLPFFFQRALGDVQTCFRVPVVAAAVYLVVVVVFLFKFALRCRQLIDGDIAVAHSLAVAKRNLEPNFWPFQAEVAVLVGCGNDHISSIGE